MKLSPIFVKPLFNWSLSKFKFKLFDESLKSFENKKYLEAIYLLLNYINPKLIKKYWNKSKTNFKIPHGKWFVNIKIEDNKIFIDADFVIIDKNSIIPIWRKLLDLNMSYFNLSYFVIENDIVKIKYSCDLELADPYKIYEVFKHISHCLDTYMDEFIEKFWAKIVNEPNFIFFKDSEYIKIKNNIDIFVEETEKYYDYFMKKLFYWYTLDVILQFLLNIDCYVSPKWILKKDLKDTINSLLNRDIEIKERIFIWKNFLTELKNYKIDYYKKYIYQDEKFITYKYLYLESDVNSYLENNIEEARKEYSKWEFIWLTLTVRHYLFYLLYIWDIDIKIFNTIISLLDKSSNIEWEKSWKRLYEWILNIKPSKYKISSNEKLLNILWILWIIIYIYVKINK